MYVLTKYIIYVSKKHHKSKVKVSAETFFELAKRLNSLASKDFIIERVDFIENKKVYPIKFAPKELELQRFAEDMIEYQELLGKDTPIQSLKN